MKKLSLFILFLIVLWPLFAQEKVSSTYEKRSIDKEFSYDKVYHKETGKKISKKEFKKLVKQNPDLHLEPVYDNEGNTIKYLYVPGGSGIIAPKKRNNDAKTEAYHPTLTFKTLDEEKIKLKDLKGKMVILRFEFEADTFRFKKQEIAEMDQKINATKRASEIEAIIIFNATKKQILSSFDTTNSNFKVIPNGFNFQRIMNIRSFPYTIILDKQGKLLEELPASEGIDIQELLNKSSAQ